MNNRCPAFPCPKHPRVPPNKQADTTWEMHPLSFTRSNNRRNSHRLRCGEVTVAYTWHGLDFTLIRAAVFCGLEQRLCVSSLSTNKEDAFESQNGVTAVQSSRVEQGGHCGHESRLALEPQGPACPWLYQTPGLHPLSQMLSASSNPMASGLR